MYNVMCPGPCDCELSVVEVEADSHSVTLPDGFLNLYLDGSTEPVATFTPGAWQYVIQVEESV
jgi:hypothetical protein